MARECKRVLLLAPPNDFLENRRPIPPLGLIYVGTALRLRGHSVSIAVPDTLQDVCDLANTRYDFLGITSTTRQYPDAVQILNYWKRIYPDTVVALGGPHATSMPHEALRNGFDVVVTGEADLDIPALVEEVVRAPSVVACSPVADMDGLPAPDLALVRDSESWRPFMGEGEDPEMRVAPILLSRGCPFRCAFCGPHALYRRRSGTSIASEVRLRHEEGYGGLVIVDDLPFRNWLEALEFCQSIKSFGMRFRCNYRPNLLTSDVAALLKNSGCCRVQLGVESVNADTLRSIGRPDPGLNARAVEICREVGLPVKAMFVWGLPGDDGESADRLIDWVQRHRPDAVQISMFTPLPGSPLWDAGLGRRLADYTKAAFFPATNGAEAGVGNEQMNAVEMRRLYLRIVDGCKHYSTVDRGLTTEPLPMGGST